MNEKKVHPLISAIMNLRLDKKKIIQILFISALVLLGLDLLIGKLFVKSKVDSIKIISIEKTNKIFETSLSLLGIDEKLVNIKKKNNYDQPLNYIVTVPNDLSIPLILTELKNSFSDQYVEMIFSEKVIGGKTSVEIKQNGKLLLKAEMNYDKNIFRTGGFIAFILEGFEYLDEQNIKSLLKAPELFGIFLSPSKNNLKLADSISNYRKEVVVLLNDDISELEFKLSDAYSAKRLTGSINSIVSGFRKSVGLVIDANSDLYNSSVYSLLKKEFDDRKILFLKKKNILSLDGNSIEEKTNSLRTILNKAKNNQSKVISIEAAEFFSYLPEIIKYRKIGYKFINPSEVLPHLSK